MLSALLRPESRTFGLAYQVALFEFRPLLARMLESAAPPDPPTRALLHISLANYAAGAIIMPYAPFLAAAVRYRYEVDRLSADLGPTVEPLPHRLTTLSRTGAPGLPSFILRVLTPVKLSTAFPRHTFPS